MSFIRTAEQFQAHVGINQNTELAPFLPDLRVVETQRLRPLLGAALYHELQALPDADVAALLDPAPGSPADVRGELLRLVQCAAANLAALEYLAVQQVQISDVGVHIFSDGGKKTAFQWQINELRASFRRKGFNALEEVLEYLDAHLDAPALAAWATSDAATASHKLFIATARQFSEHYDIGNSRLTYLALLPTLRKVERFQLEAVLGTALFLELREQLMDRDLSADNRLLLDHYLRPALAHLVVAKALNGDVGLGLNGDAIELNVYRADDSNNKEADAGIAQLLTMKAAQALADGQVFLTKLRQFLNAEASATRFVSYFTSTAYTSPTAPRPTVSNAQFSPTYGFF